MAMTSHGLRLRAVLEANREAHLYDLILELSAAGQDDPPVIFGWQNVGAFVDAIHTAQAQAATLGGEPLPADPLSLPAAVTVREFKEALLEYARVDGAEPRVDTTCLPCSMAEAGRVAFALRDLDQDPWMRRIKSIADPQALPIAVIYVTRNSRSDMLDRIIPHLPNSLWG